MIVQYISQPHLGKCFGNIKMLEIKTLPRQPPTVKTITSSEGESINMPKYVFRSIYNVFGDKWCIIL